MIEDKVIRLQEKFPAQLFYVHRSSNKQKLDVKICLLHETKQSLARIVFRKFFILEKRSGLSSRKSSFTRRPKKRLQSLPQECATLIQNRFQSLVNMFH